MPCFVGEGEEDAGRKRERNRQTVGRKAYPLSLLITHIYARVIQNRSRTRTARAGRKSPVDASGLLGTSAEGIVKIDDSLHLTEAVTELGELRL